ncbi:glutamine--tRNA ligase/YqeY domain fusion protein [Brooklawnia propionicigenes]|uniref:Glutamine--tRNA ligase n=1 Tax=Brooklawnia propionicigenes TaxID=3041175 RepID=A0AAN0KHT0_9ACTN|nr:glutamine--tRNA ligase/YqeY domain fusion protein [Brooklawnia sp. SH051]MEA5119917.1 glutamine--tRNA ligase/YqeY domain fusion protein [Propionibacterium sp.]BEH01965.1 glutamine--tRNA ligase/YqeY domain fusion protein [Brooklawnia sp. SH051]
MSESVSTTPVSSSSGANDFISDIIRADNEQGTYSGRVQTRFPPEPNGQLHIGHAKAITVDFDSAQNYDGICNLRFDDTNPDTEETEFVDAIIADLRWLGFEPANVFYASDYFEQLYEWAEYLIGKGLAYVDEQDGETISAQRGGYGKPGIDSPFRDRPIEENLDQFRRMRAGEYADGSRVLRAKIDMNDENMQLRDPVLYRIRRGHHHRTHDAWVIYPTYDWAHGQSDAIEGVTHSLCTLEFVSHRPLYDWCLEQLPLPYEKPKQIEFARLELTHTVTSKRRLAKLVTEGILDGWDDPRMPTLAGLRKRGYPASAIVAFCRDMGVSKTNARHAIEELESYVRRDLNKIAQRRMAVLHPIKLTITNWPAGQVDYFDVMNNPENADDGTRKVAFTGELYIEAEDFAEVPPPKFYRLSIGREVRLRGAYFVTATDVVTDDQGNVVEVLATYDPASQGGNSPDGRKVKSTIHWVSRPHAVEASVALYDRLFTTANPGEATGEPLDDLNPASRVLLNGCQVEAALTETAPGEVVQFERLGYFAADPDRPMHFHRTVGLRDEWAAIQKRRR